MVRVRVLSCTGEGDGECNTVGGLNNCNPGGWDVYQVLVPSPPPPPMWTITAGSSYCSVTTGGTCVTDGVGLHSNNERCTMTASVALLATSTYFSTEAGWDYITIGTTRYSGTSGPSGVAMAAGETMTWYADYLSLIHI